MPALCSSIAASIWPLRAQAADDTPQGPTGESPTEVVAPASAASAPAAIGVAPSAAPAPASAPASAAASTPALAPPRSVPASAPGPAASGATPAPASAPPSTPAQGIAREVSGAGFDTGTFWRVTSPDGARAHLLGTIHLGRPDDLSVPPQAWDQLRQARRVVVELAHDTLDAHTVAKLQRLPASQSMARHLSRDEQGRLLQRLNRAGVRPAALLHFKPWVLTQWLQVGGMQPAMSLDDQVVLLARMAGIPVSSLESVHEQFSAFECIDTVEQVLLLKETLAMREEFFVQLNQDMLSLYRTQRVGELVDQIERRFPISPPARAIEARSTACTIARRNLRFAQRLRPLLGAGDVFVAIGAAHLHGHDGVLAQLAQGGYRIERMPVEEPTAATPAAKTAATMPGTRPATMPENPR